MPQFFLHPDDWENEAALVGSEAVHCVRVLRASVGDEIEIFDGAGRYAKAKILSTSKNRVTLALGEVATEPPPMMPLTLAVAVLKGKAMDWLVQKAVELEVSVIQPLATQHMVAKPGAGSEEKWRRTVLEACKQCGRAHLPQVKPVMELRDYLAQEIEGSGLIASLRDGARPLAAVIDEARSTRDSATGFHVAIGPEGDFGEDEYAAAEKAGFEPVSFGAHVMRSETAAIFAACACQLARQESQSSCR